MRGQVGRRALNYGRISYRDVKEYLEYVKRCKIVDDENIYLFPVHENLRSASDYR